MNQIFLFLSVLGNLCLCIALLLGWQIEDAGSLAEAARQQVSMHFLFALGATTLALLVHAVVLTYFMGTGRWIEETSAAYGFEGVARQENIRLKYRVIPGMVLCMLLMVTTGAFGAISDPASNMQMDLAPTIHFTLAVTTVCVNIAVSVIEYLQIVRNSKIVNAVYEEVRAVRRERGLDPGPDVPVT